MRTTVALVLFVATTALGADHPVAGDKLVLKDRQGDATRRTVRFKATRDLGIDPTAGGDPRGGGATLEIVGRGAGDGTSGIVPLDQNLWVGLGTPPGAKGYKWSDRSGGVGIRKVAFKGGSNGGSLTIAGKGSTWGYAVAGSQTGPIDVRFTIGADTWCARFDATTFLDNRTDKLRAAAASAPADCAVPPPPTCGNGVAEGTEECDDGNTNDGDGCSSTCALENTSAVCDGVPTVSGTALGSVRVASGLDRPVYVTAPPLDPNRIFIVEQDGVVRIVKNGTPLPTPFIDVTGDVTCCGEQGLLSMAFAPDYETSGIFYLSYTNNGGLPEVRRYTVSANPDVANTTGTLVISTEDFASNHNGGLVLFGPDGYLYFAMGDGGGGDDPEETGQDLTRLLGKIMRIDVNAATYTIPPSNPFVGAPPALPEIWAYGVRNPWRISFDRGTGDLYIADVGQGAREEVDVQPASSTGGENYGWDIFEGTLCHEPEPPATMCPSPPTGFTFPVLEYDHGQGCSITGGYVYRGCAMPDLAGTYFYSDICSAFIRTFKGVSGGAAQNLDDRTSDVAPGGGLSIGGVSSFGEDARGELYVVDYGGGVDGQGEVYKIVPGS